MDNIHHIPNSEQIIQEQDVKLNAVIDLTNAINANQPLDGLSSVFSNYLLHDFDIEYFGYKLLDDGVWKTGYISHPSIDLPEISKAFDPVVSIGHFAKICSHQYIIPVFYNQDIYAYGFVDFKPNVPEIFLLGGLNFIQNLLSLTIVAIENEKLIAYRIRQEALRKEIEIARQVQSLLFPKKLPQNQILEINATYIPHLSVSGDYYDYIRIDDHQFMLCVADVSGKGMSAALLMSNFQATLRTLVMQKLPLEQIVHQLNTILCQNSNLERFITCFIAVINTENRILEYINAGHNPPILISNCVQRQLLTKGTTILGVFPELPFLHSEKVAFEGELLFVGFTDGLTETDNPQGEEYGLERLHDFIFEHAHLSLEQLHTYITNEILNHSVDKGFKDDITLLSCRLKIF